MTVQKSGKTGGPVGPQSAKVDASNDKKPPTSDDVKNAYDQLRGSLELAVQLGKQDLENSKRNGGGPEAKKVPNDGVLQGTEWTKTVDALGKVQKAVQSLKPVFPRAKPKEIDRPPPGPVQLYGVPIRDDLSNLRKHIKDNLTLIHNAKDTPKALSPVEAKAADKAVANLEKALGALGGPEW